eukprot:gb/GEZN01003885.1/.p1 GENE.gb/GEZN01003885.1/~~gb/GEZN01003885.1/.p1  ORF type:complete len:501 (-),score=57.29 gb/GEZN01003885.1/:456-1958(-)
MMEEPRACLILSSEEKIFAAKWDLVALEQTVRNILRQVEYYFSNQNLWQDEILHSIIRKNRDRWVPLSYVAALERINVITTDPRLLILTLRQSRKVEMNEDCTMVRRVAPLPTKNPRMVAMRTIYVDQLPLGSTIKTIRKRFAKFGRVLYVTKCSRIGDPDPINAHDSLPVDPNSEVRTCFIEYAKLEGAKKAVTMIQSFNQKRSKLFQLMHGQGSSLQGNYEVLDDDSGSDDALKTADGEGATPSPRQIREKSVNGDVDDEETILFKREYGEPQALIEHLTQLVIREEIKEGMRLAKQLQHTQKEINMLDYVGVHVLTKFSYLRKIGQMPEEFESPVPPVNEDTYPPLSQSVKSPGGTIGMRRTGSPKTPGGLQFSNRDTSSWATPRNLGRFEESSSGNKWFGARPTASANRGYESSGKKAKSPGMDFDRMYPDHNDQLDMGSPSSWNHSNDKRRPSSAPRYTNRRTSSGGRFSVPGSASRQHNLERRFNQPVQPSNLP